MFDDRDPIEDEAWADDEEYCTCGDPCPCFYYDGDGCCNCYGDQCPFDEDEL
jgi:hypothetical protein